MTITVNARKRCGSVIGACSLAIVLATDALAAQDVMLQTMDQKIVTGIVDDTTGVGTLGTRVYRGNFLSIFAASNPGFYALSSVNPNLPPGSAGFPSELDVSFDLLPMRIGDLTSNLFYWNGSDLGDNGLDESDVHFAIPTNVVWQVGDDAHAVLADGTDQFVPGELIQQTSEDANPFDGVDTGTLHTHLALQLKKLDVGTPPAGVYMIAWQVRAEGFETSDPFVFVHRTSTVSDAVRNVAADWAVANIDSLFGPELPGDYNNDLVVDAADYTVWRNSFGMAIKLPNEDDSPNFVDEADYNVWKMHYGESIPNAAGGHGAAIVPEPSATLLALIAMVLLAAKSPRQRDYA